MAENEGYIGVVRRTSDQTVDGNTAYNILPRSFVSVFRRNDEKPSVANVLNWIANNIQPLTIVNFRDGQDGQTITVLGDGHTSVAHNDVINIDTGSTLLLEDGRRYTFQYIVRDRRGVWYGSSGATGSGSTGGEPGTPGSIIRNGTSVPSNSLGINGDYYIRTSTGDLYYKSGGVYSILVNLKGPTGNTGNTGPEGPPGYAPVYIAEGETFTVPANRQLTYGIPIEIDGNLVVDGYLIQVEGI